MNITLFKASFKSNFKALLIFSIIMVFYFSMIIVMYDPMTTDSMAALIEMLPQQLINMLGFTLQVPTYTGFVASYFYGFLIILFPTILIIMVTYRVMGKLIDQGSMAYLLSTPNSRISIALTQGLSVVFLLTVLIVVVTSSGIIFSEIFYSSQLEIGKFILINVGAIAYFFAVSSLSFFANVFFNEAKNALSVASAFPVGFFLIQMVAQLGEQLDFMRYFTILTLYQPNDILQDNYQWWPLMVLFVIGVVGYGASIVVFNKRNLSI